MEKELQEHPDQAENLGERCIAVGNVYFFEQKGIQACLKGITAEGKNDLVQTLLKRCCTLKEEDRPYYDDREAYINNRKVMAQDLIKTRPRPGYYAIYERKLPLTDPSLDEQPLGVFDLQKTMAKYLPSQSEKQLLYDTLMATWWILHFKLRDQLLQKTAHEGDFEVVKYLVSKSPAPVKRLFLNHVIAAGDFELVQWLVEEQNVQPTLSHLQTVLDSEEQAIVKWLVSYSDASNKQLFLDHVIAAGDFELVQWLVEEGVRLTIFSLDTAIALDNPALVESVIQAYALQPEIND